MKNVNKQVAIILPVYNVSKYLRCCLNSIVNQTYSNIEIIAVNDGSTDNSLDILKEYKMKDSRISIVNKKNGGLMSAWIEGLKYANSDLVTFVDSDDWIDVNLIEKLYNAMYSNDSDIVISSYQEEWNNGKTKIIYNQFSSGYYEIDSFIFGKIINYDGKYRNRGLIINRWGKLIKKELLLKNIKYCDLSISYGEDVNIMIPVFGEAKSMYVINEPLYHYRMNQNSITHSYIKNMKNQIDTLYKHIQWYMEDTNQPLNVTEALKLDYLSLIISCMRNEAKNSNILIGAKKILYEYFDDDWEKISYSTSIKKFSFINKLFISSLNNKSLLLISILLILVKLRGNY